MTRKKKLVKEWIAARIAAGQGISKSLRTYAQNVGIATELAFPPSEPTKSSPGKVSSRPITETSTGEGIGSGVPNDENFEFNLPDEELFYPLSYYSCPLCNSESRLWRKGGEKAIRFQVECINKSCGHRTGWHPSSREATRIWKVTAMLHKE